MSSRINRLRRLAAQNSAHQQSNEIQRPALRKVASHNVENTVIYPALPTSVDGEPPADVPHSDALTGEWSEEQSNVGKWAMAIILIIVAAWGVGVVAGYITALYIVLALGFLLAVAGIVKPSLGILGIGIMCAVDAPAMEYLYTGEFLPYNTVNYFLLLIMALYIPFILRLRDAISRSIQVFLVLITLELFFMGSDFERGSQVVLNIATTFGLVIFFARALKEDVAFYWLGIINGVLAGLGGAVFFMQFDSLPYANPNNWSYFQMTAMFSICIAFNYAHKYNKSRVILIILAALNFTWIFLSASRGSLMVALLCVGYLFLSTRSLTLSSVMVVAAVLVGLWVSTTFVEQQLYTIERIRLLFDTSQDDRRRTSQRSAIAEAGIEIFKRNPMGIGTGDFERAVGEASLTYSGRAAHSAWIKTLVENGVPGIILLTALVASFAVVGYRQRGQGILLFGLFITIVFASAFVAKEFRGKSLWFLAASGIALMHPRDMLDFFYRKVKLQAVDTRRKLREVRYGHRR